MAAAWRQAVPAAIVQQREMLVGQIRKLQVVAGAVHTSSRILAEPVRRLGVRLQQVVDADPAADKPGIDFAASERLRVAEAGQVVVPVAAVPLNELVVTVLLAAGIAASKPAAAHSATAHCEALLVAGIVAVVLPPCPEAIVC